MPHTITPDQLLPMSLCLLHFHIREAGGRINAGSRRAARSSRLQQKNPPGGFSAGLCGGSTRLCLQTTLAFQTQQIISRLFIELLLLLCILGPCLF